MLLAVLAPALFDVALADPPVSVGGAVAVRPSYAPVTGGSSLDVPGLGGEVEGDLTFTKGIVSGRFDLDVQGTVLPTLGIVNAPPGFPVNIVRPEQAQIQVGGDTWLARGGVLNANLGLDDWDEWLNYLPTWGESFGPSPGRMAGAEVGRVFGDGGPEIDVGGGLDMDSVLPIAEASVDYQGTNWTTDSGFAAYPTTGAYMIVASGTVSPAPVVTIALDGLAGIAPAGTAETAYAGLTVDGVFLPQLCVQPTVRVEGQFDPSGFTGNAPWTASIGGALEPTSWSKILVEGKLIGSPIASDATPTPALYASFAVFRPDPD